MIQLRQYQIKLLEEIDYALYDGYTSILVTAAPGAGKTIIYMKVIQTIQSASTIVIVPTTELKEQIENELKKNGLVDVQVETIQKLMNGKSKEIDLLILDECHRFESPYWKEITDRIKSNYLIGFTATPFRSDHAPLLKKNGGIYDIHIEGPSIEELTNQNYLAGIKYYTVPIKQHIQTLPVTSRITGITSCYIKSCYTEPIDLSEDVVEQYQENFNGIPTIVFCRNIKHTKSVADDFTDEGIPAIAINGDMSKRECSQIIEDFKNDKYKVISVCKKGELGLNLPNCKVAIFLKHTNSLATYIQQTGRILRYNGSIANIVDMVGNLYTHGKVEQAEEYGKLQLV